jgi:hypothetical protein
VRNREPQCDERRRDQQWSAHLVRMRPGPTSVSDFIHLRNRRHCWRLDLSSAFLRHD